MFIPSRVQGQSSKGVEFNVDRSGIDLNGFTKNRWSLEHQREPDSARCPRAAGADLEKDIDNV
jgi:hypothetical protein